MNQLKTADRGEQQPPKGKPQGVDQEWFPGARILPSPNFGERPEDQQGQISLLVIHSISLPPGEFGGPFIDQLFTNQLDPAAHPYFAEIEGMKVSSHFLIRRDGELVQYVPCEKRAWHAGQSSWQGRQDCNDFSVGIELEGFDYSPYDRRQYLALAQLVRALSGKYGIQAGQLTGHEHIAPGRKTDPGPAFDWAALHILMAELDG